MRQRDGWGSVWSRRQLLAGDGRRSRRRRGGARGRRRNHARRRRRQASHAGHARSALRWQPRHSRWTSSDFQPRSMLHVPETSVPRARFPVIDIHTHLTFRARDAGVPRRRCRHGARTSVRAAGGHGRRNLRTMVNLTGGTARAWRPAFASFDGAPRALHDVHRALCDRPASPASRSSRPTSSRERTKPAPAALKVLKTLGLYLRDGGTGGPLVRIDDPRFDPMWEACGALDMPVAIHIADPEAFFLPTDRFNERFEELNDHPDWSFHGRGFPPFAELLAARNRVFARHPRTTLHRAARRAHAEDLAEVSASLDRFPNMHVEIGARIGELGRQPRTARRFFDTLSGPHPLRHRRRPARARDAAADVRRRLSTRSTTGSSKPRTSTSTTRRRRCRRRDGGGSTASGCRTGS